LEKEEEEREAKEGEEKKPETLYDLIMEYLKKKEENKSKQLIDVV
jgi:hypothetical protein